jgi:hypothetical protein
LVRQRFDEPALLGVTEGPPGRSSRCSETITESCRMSQNRDWQFEFTSLQQ